MSTSLDRFNAKIFSEQLHTQFKVHFGGAEPMMLELIEVMERNLSPQIELFTLQFRGAVAPRLAQQTHRFEHDKLGPFAIFMTAIGTDPEQRILYESVFQRFRKP